MRRTLSFEMRSVVMALLCAPLSLMANFVDWILFSDKSYAKEMDVRAYILTHEQACDAVCNPSYEPVQLDYQGLYGHNQLYLLVQIKNTGKKHAWGWVSCQIPTVHKPFKISFLGDGNVDGYVTQIITVGGLFITKSDKGQPQISFWWDELYTK